MQMQVSRHRTGNTERGCSIRNLEADVGCRTQGMGWKGPCRIWDAEAEFRLQRWDAGRATWETGFKK